MRNIAKAALTGLLAAAAAAMLAVLHAQAEMRVHFIDVGQGDAILIQADGHAVLVDAGDDNGMALAYLREQGVSRLDLAVATHAHADHIGGFVSVIPALEVGALWYNGQEHTTRTFERFIDAALASGAAYHEPSRGEAAVFGAMHIEVLHPRGSAADYTGHLHDMNVVLKVTYGDVSFLLTGDAEEPVERDLLASGMDLSAQVLKLGHHGSRTSSSTAFVAAVAPQVAVYQAGAGNSYGHPHAEAIAPLAQAGIPVYGTDVLGTVVAVTDGTSLEFYAAGPAVQPTPQAASDGGCIDINSATAGELTRIVHVGEARAQAIKQGRPWRSVDDLVRIRGIGEASLADIRGQALACTRS